MEIKRLMHFIGLLEKLKCNTRHSWTSSGRRESVAEHSFMLAVMAYLVKDEFPEADMEMCYLDVERKKLGMKKRAGTEKKVGAERRFAEEEKGYVGKRRFAAEEKRYVKKGRSAEEKGYAGKGRFAVKEGKFVEKGYAKKGKPATKEGMYAEKRKSADYGRKNGEWGMPMEGGRIKADGNRTRMEGKKNTERRKDAEGRGRNAEGKARNAGERKSGSDNRRKMGQDVKIGKGRCRAFGECGGCQMLHLPYEKQLALKEKETANLLKPYVRLEGIIGMEQPEHYRNKVSAAFTHDRQGKPLSGVYKEGTHYIIPVEECILENQKADEIIGTIRSLLPSFKIKTYNEDTGYGLFRHVVVRIGHATGQIMVVLVLSSPILPSKNNFVKALLKQHPDITTVVINVNERKTSMVLGDNGQVIYGKGYIEDVLCGITFRISPKSFYQVNSVQTEKLYNKAMEYAGLTGKETVLDAYCGIGTIGMAAAGKAGRVIGVELNEDAVKDAVANARRNKIKNIEFYQKDAGEFMVQLAEQGEWVDVVFMDPPRTGSDEVFLESLAKLMPKKVVYVSCNPETLARDLEYMAKKGYRAVKGVCVDMFPFCGHVECVVLMSRVKK